jgi:predicted cobalt transporter CbtA
MTVVTPSACPATEAPAMTMTYTEVLKRALMAGLIMGVVVGAYMLTVVEPVVDRAIALEEQMSAAEEPDADDGHHDEPLYTRGEQKGGGVGAMVLYALVIALVFGTIFSWRRHVLPGDDDFTRAVWLAAVGFASFGLVPAMKYPASPPAVGNPGTVGERTLQYLGLIAITILLVIALARLSKVLRRSLDDPSRIIVVTAATVVVFGVAFIILPGTPDAIDPAVPARLVWDFRLRSVGALALMWIGFGMVFGWLLTRPSAARRHDAVDDRSLAASNA